MSTVTAQQVIDQARLRHRAFSELQIHDGALLRAMDQRQRTLVLMYGGAVDGLLNTTMTIATLSNNVLVQLDGSGNPVYGTTYQDGWPVHMDANGAPYVDFTETPIAGDPFGKNGGVAGWPLPADFLKVIEVSCILTDFRWRPVDIIPEVARNDRTRFTVPTAFISGNRLVPVRPLSANNQNDVWDQGITSVYLSYVALPSLTAMTDAILLPAVLIEALIAGVALVLAMNAPISAGDKSAFMQAAAKSEEEINEFSVDVVSTATRKSVLYRG